MLTEQEAEHKSQNDIFAFENIPEELKARSQWVLWRKQKKKNNPTQFDKIPISPKGCAMNAHDPENWLSFDDVSRFHRLDFGDGIGFDLTTHDHFCGIDLDHVRDPATGHLEPWAAEIVRACDSYTETTPSGEGVRIWMKGVLPGPGDKSKIRKGFEIYDHGRFFTVTGEHIPGSPTTIEDRQELIDRYYHEYFPEKAKGYANGYTNGHAQEPVEEDPRSEEETVRLLEEMGEALAVISGEDRENWLNMGMAIHSVDSSPRGFTVWDTWAQRWPQKHDGQDSLKIWRSFRPKERQITHRSLFRLAKQYGWKATQGEAGDHTGHFSFTDTGNAQRLATRHGQNIRYVHTWKMWFIWDDKRWVRDTRGAIYQLAKETARSIATEETKGVQDDKRFKELLSWSKQSLNQSRLRAMVDLAQSEPGIPVQVEDLDRNPWLFNVQNGTIDLKTGQLQAHRREDLITKISPAVYDPTATAPTWDKFLKRISGEDDALIEYICRAVGYSLTGSTGEECLFFLHGSGRNGKTKLLETIGATMGDYGKPTPFSTFLHKAHDDVSNDVAALRGARFVTAVEVNEGRRLNESLIKNMTGGDRVSARFLFSEFFEFTPVFKLWLAANAKPIIRGTDGAIWERIKLIPFTVTIPEAERDKHLLEKLTAELSGILLWAIEGCLRWQQKGLPMPEKIKEATASYRRQMDVLGSFIEEKCEVGDEYFVSVASIFDAYLEWCKSSGEESISKKAFGMRLEERGFLPDRTNAFGRIWRGLRLWMN